MRKFDLAFVKRGQRLVRKSCAAVLALMLLLQYIPFSAGAFSGFFKPLVYNGDFEETGTYAVPAGWCYKKQSESGSLKLESGNGAEGQYVRMEPADGAALLETAGDSLIALEGGERYTLTFRAYSHGQLHLEMEMYTADGTACGEDLSTEGCLVSAEAEWVKRTLTFRADNEARYLLLRFVAENGVAGVDSVVLKSSAAKETAARMTPLYTAGAPTNQLTNGDFSAYTAGADGQVTALTGWELGSLNSCGIAVQEGTKYGNALEITIPASITYNPRLRHTATNLQAGKTYEFSYWIKTTAASAADARVYLVLRKSDLTGSAIMLTSNPDTRVSVTNGGWKRMYFEYTVPDGYDHTVIDFQFEKKGKEVTYSFAGFTVTEPETDTAPIQNGDFARHVLDDNGNILVLKNWDVTSLNGCGLTLGSDAAHGVTLDMAVPASIGYAPRLRHTATNLQEGKTYEFSYWVSTNVADAALAEIYMVLRKADLTGEAIAFTSADTYDSRVRATDGQWKLICFDYTIPAGYGNAVVDFQIGRKNAVTYRLAAVSAQEIDKDPALITNGDFSRYRLDENGALLSLTDWKTEYLGQAKNYGLERDADRGMALKVVNNNKKSCNFSHLPTSMREGETYKITYWVKTDATVSADANTYLVLQKKKYTSNADNIILTTSAGSDVNTAVYATNGEWRKVTAFVQIPAGWDQAALMIVIANRPDSSRAETTYWYAGFIAEQKADPGDNLDFESDDVDAENWSAATSGTGDIRIAAGESYNGSNALCVANKGRLGITYAASRKIPVKPSATYEVTYWAKLTGTSDANGWIQPVQYNASGKPANGASFDKDATDNRLQKISGDITYRWEWRMVGNTAWTRVKRAFTVANDAAYIYLRFLTSGAGTEFYIDDITLREIAPTQNFDFEETDGDGMPSYWYFTDARATEATVETDETYYHSGSRSVHITKASLTSYNAFETAYRFLVLPGNTYEFSFWMASRNASPHLNLRLNMVYYDDNGNRVYKPDGSHSITYGTMTYLNSDSAISEWTQVITRSVVPEGASSAVLQFYSQEGEYELWLDDIFVDIVENEKDVIAEHNDFHAVDQDGNIAGWQLRSVTGSADFRADEGYGTLVNRSGENYMEFTTTALETSYQYYLVGKYKTDTDAVAEMHFSDWAGRPVETDAVTAALPANGDWTVFELSFTAPSCTTAQLRVGTRSPGTVQLDDILIYMVGKPVTAGDWKGNWVWFQEEATTDALYQSRYFRYEIDLDAEPQFCPLQFTADDRYTLYVNGTEIASNMGASGDTWSSVQVAYLEPYLKKGRNVLCFEVWNNAAEAALLFDGKWTLQNGSQVICASDASVKSRRSVEGVSEWMMPDSADTRWIPCRVIGKPPVAPWGAIFYNSSIYSETSFEILSIDGDGAAAKDGVFEFSMDIRLNNALTSNFPLNVDIWQKNSVNKVSSSSLTLVTRTDMAKWPVDERFTVKFRMDVPFYLTTGSYTLQLDDKYISISNKDITDAKFISFTLEQEVSTEASVSKIETVNGAPTLVVNGELTPFYAYSRPDSNSRTRDYEPSMKKSGIQLYVVRQGCLGKPDYDYCWSADGVVDYEAFDDPIYETLSNNNDAYLIVQVGMYAPDWWIEENPDERVVVSNRDGSFSTYTEGGSVSACSEKFTREAGEVLRQLMEHMKTQSYYSRIVGINLCSEKSFENMYWGAKTTDYAPDYSKPAIRKFRAWLREEYGTVEALRAAWNDATVTFDTAQPPTFAECGQMGAAGGFVDVETQKRVLDHNLFLNDVVTERLLYWGNIINEVHNNNIVLGCFNGYLFSAGSYMDIGAQHTSFYKLLQSDTFSFFVSPANYSERLLGTADTYMGCQDAVQAYGKLVVIEEDHRTCLVMHYAGTSWDAKTDEGVGGTHTMQETLLQMKKNVANAMVSGNGIWFFDMHGGWFDDDQFYSLSRVCADEYLVSQYKDKTLDGSDIAYYIDDEYLSYFLAISDGQVYPSNFITYSGFRLQRKQLNRIGQSYDVYLMSNLAAGKVKGHKINIIFCSYQMTQAERDGIRQQLQKDGQIVVFLYANGVSDGKTNDIHLMEEITGIPLCYEVGWGNLNVEITAESTITAGLVGKQYGPQGAAGSFDQQNPLIYADTDRDPSLTVLGTLVGTDKPGLVIKDMGDWTSIYSASANLPYQLLRNLIGQQGGTFYSDNPNDIIWNNGSYVALHSTTAGTKTLHLDGSYAVYDVFAGEFLSMDTDTVTYENRSGDTRLFRLQQPQRYEVTSAVRGGHGSISPVGITSMAWGGSFQLKITPEEGYTVHKILLNGAEQPITDTVSLTDIQQNHLIQVSFKKLSAKDNEDPVTPVEPTPTPDKTPDGNGTSNPGTDEPAPDGNGTHTETVKRVETRTVNVLGAFELPLWAMLTALAVIAAGIVLWIVLAKKRQRRKEQ